MIDSVLLRHSSKTPVSKRILEKFRWRGETYSFRDAAGENPPCLFYRPTPYGTNYLAVEASLPKILYGHNLIVLSQPEIAQALDLLSSFATEHFGMDFNASTATVGRVDYCINFDVGTDRIHAYLKAAMEASPSRLKRLATGKIETVEFFNRQRKIYLYDKGRQCESLLKKNKISKELAASSIGLLRLESRFRNPVVVRRMLIDKLNLADQTALTVLDLGVAKTVLTEALSSFELDKQIVQVDQRIEKLQQFYGHGSKLQQLLGFLQLCDYYGQDNLVARGIVKRSSYYNHIKDLRRAGVLIYTNYHSTLPALSVR